MNLAELLNESCISIERGLADKNAVLQKIAELAQTNPVLSNLDVKQILETLQAREELGSTGFGKSIAIPHCRIPNITDFVLGIIILPDHVDFDSIDSQKIKIAVFVIAPDQQANDHIRLLSTISQVLRIPGAVEEITAQKTPELVRESFLKFVEDDITAKTPESKNLFHVVIQDEDMFHDILPVFSGLNASAEIVIEAKNTSDYLAKVPLFAGLLSDNLRSFCRVIIAVVEKKMTNETIRRIENITGPLDKCPNVMLIVQDIIYTAGSMETY